MNPRQQREAHHARRREQAKALSDFREAALGLAAVVDCLGGDGILEVPYDAAALSGRELRSELLANGNLRLVLGPKR